MNTELARKVLARVEADPDALDMRTWGKVAPCGTVACLAGHTLLADGWEMRPRREHGLAVFTKDSRVAVGDDVGEVARELLELDDGEFYRGGSDLFWCCTDEDVAVQWLRDITGAAEACDRQAELQDEIADAASANQAARECARCGRVLVAEDEQGWYCQVPVTDPRAPGLTFMDRVHECDGKPHDARPRD